MPDIDEMYEDFLAQAANHFVPEETLRQEREEQYLLEKYGFNEDCYPACCDW